MIELNKIYCENCLETMKRMPGDFVDMVITSPPYDNRRTYGNVHRFTFEEFKSVALNLYRVMKDGGVVVWVVADETVNFCESLTSFKQAIYFVEGAMFKLLDTMIYFKRNAPPPFPVVAKVRYTPSFEYMFVFVKGTKPKAFNPIMCKCFRSSGKWNNQREKDGSFKRYYYSSNGKNFRNIFNVWDIAPGNDFDNIENKSIHPAVFPKQLVINHIKSWSNEGDLIYDPFMGSGSVAKVSMIMNRKFIGSEINNEYVKYANLTLMRSKKRKKGSQLWLKNGTK